MATIAEQLAARLDAYRIDQEADKFYIEGTDDELYFEPGYGDAEGQFFIIEYVGSTGGRSMRPITVRAINPGAGGVPVLWSLCHLRNGMRGFRVDRIKSCSDPEGEVFSDIPAFMIETFGMHPLLASYLGTSDDAKRWTVILDIIRHPAMIISAMARADRKLKRSELEIETDYLSKLCESDGIFPSEMEMAAMRRYLLRLRPNAAKMQVALDGVAYNGARSVEQLVRAMVAVMDADGRRHPDELKLLDAIMMELAGHGL